MTKEKTLLILGIIVIALPNMGVPNLVEKIISLVIGFLVIILVYALHFEKKKKIRTEIQVKLPEQDVVKEKVKRAVRAKTEKNSVISPIKISQGENLTGFTYISHPSRKTTIVGQGKSMTHEKS